MSYRIELPELGEGQFVEIKDPKFIPWGVQKEITSIVMDSKESSAQLDVAEMVAISLIKSGNVLSEDDVPFVFPIDATTVRDIPSIVIEKVSVKFAELKKEGTDRKN